MDTQMLFLYGNTTGPPGKDSDGEFLWDEYARAQGLCNWLHEQEFDAPGHGIEGIVRMSAGFELIWCNFSSPSLRLVSRFNASVPLLDYNRTAKLGATAEKHQRPLSAADKDGPIDLPAPDWEIDWDHEPFVASQQWDWFTSSSRSYNLQSLASNREPSIRLLDNDVVTLYSSVYSQHHDALLERERSRFTLTPDGLWQRSPGQNPRRDALQQFTRRRSLHRVGDLRPQDVVTLRQEMHAMVSRTVNSDLNKCQEAPAVSWSHTSDMVVDTFAKRLSQLQQLLQHLASAEISSPTHLHRRYALLRERVHALIMPFFEYPPSEGAALHDLQQQSQRLQASLDRCKHIYLPPPLRSEGLHAARKDRESDHVGQAIEEVVDGICSVLISVGNSIETIWLRDHNHGYTKFGDEEMLNLHHSMRNWQDEIEELMAWLGWAPHWLGCDRLCAWDVSCPFSPFSAPGG